MPLAYLALGSNLGVREQNLDAAIEALRSCGQVRRVSRRYRTAPLGFTEQPEFLNQVVELETELAPELLLARLQEIEQRLGRTRSFRNAPRVIDLDILLYGDVVRDDPALTIPHPRMTQRAFVLRPLAELLDHVLDSPMEQLLAGVADQQAEPIDRA